jgi:hypothetical protein
VPPIILPTPPPQTPLPPSRPMGRILAPDGRDMLFRSAEMQRQRLGTITLRRHRIFLPATPPLRWRPQLLRSSCTEEAGTSRMCGWPNPRRLSDLPYAHYGLYERAQELDEWPGSEKEAPYYEGSSGRGVCRALREMGLITEWHNAFTVDDLRMLLLADTTDWTTAGPVTVGTNWYDSMFLLRDKYLEITPRAKVVGGHQTCYIGANDNSETFYLINSWEDMRLCRIRYETVRRLLEREDGDAQFFVEVPQNPQRTALNPMEGVLDFGMDRGDVATVSGSPLPPMKWADSAGRETWAA